MVGTVPPTSASLQPQTAPQSSSATTTTAAAVGGVAASAEEEAFKRNTDCVYFLASPLTCKKGSECEYRHSDTARVNPRDCWYWLHGNCLNPKCAFRHPPLDGLLGPQIPNPVGASVAASQPATAPTAPVSSASGKQGVACIFFQKGNCLKGDWCPFSHAPTSANNKVMQSPAAIPATEPPMFKKTFIGLEKGSQEKKASQTSVLKPVELTNKMKLINKIETAPAKLEFGIKKNFQHSSGIDDELHGYRPIDTRPANDVNRVSLPSRIQQPLQVSSRTSTLNNKDAEEVSREPSPGFDVLVDNELGDSEYYHSEDQFVRARDQDGMIEYFDDHSGDYSSMVDADRDLYRNSRTYDSYERPQGRYAREQRRSSSERISGGLAHQDRRQYGRADSPDQVDHSDLRLHLSKHRRVNGLRSVINHDYARERPDDRGHQGSRRDLRHDRERQETSLSSRLRGRIKIPGSSSSGTDGSDPRFDREMERGRDRSRSSPGRSQVSSRLRDRIKGVVQEDINNDGRNNRGERMRRDIMSDINDNFAAPKSLAELKSRKNADESDQLLTGKRKYLTVDYQQQTGDDLSFEGPKPLEEILKRKRGAETSAFEGSRPYRNTESNNQNRSEERLMKSEGMDSQVVQFNSSKNESNHPIHENEEYKSASSLKTASEGAQSADIQFLPQNANEAEVEEGMIVDDGPDDQDPEAYDHGDDEYDYEQGDGDNYNLDEGENGEPEEEYLDDDDDGDDFAKKMGVMY